MRREGWIGAGVVIGAVGAAVGGLTYGGRELLHRQADIARGVIGKPLGEKAPKADKVYRKRFGDAVDLVMLGDSLAAGLGADLPSETLGARLAKGAAKRIKRSVRLTTVARVGNHSSELMEQIGRLPEGCRPDVAVIVVGGNDITHRHATAASVAHLEDAIRTLQGLGAEVVVGTCPDLGMLRAVPQPLRTLGSIASRQLASAQREAALALGARVVDLAQVAGPFFVTNPDEMFSVDRFHPSSLGYRRTAKAMLPSVVAAFGGEVEVPFGHHVPLVR
ncbi:SGNH/GDSL hydrolase family protein [Nocardioides jiangxiensis]|uniref:SGNH/GDSL hydrolase family protein n=1 Tax=Nocardioides jiangxiensis TaxID=3064524 RepID=A0ABT9AZ88_9ACTN|nr:SGNH/GDSL hydrolase family protein [Nocardioides sp. WY-20]MDO7867757.1 SGNH/GDSL hydrolase family protein [Nocardioides sp. WY-20]